MTVIAYRDRVLAGDTQIITGNTLSGHLDKVWSAHGRLWGLTGLVREWTALRRWVNQGKGAARLSVRPSEGVGPLEPPSASESTLVMVDPGGGVYEWHDGAWLSLDHNRFYAFGSGAAGAVTAMTAGASAAVAVAAVCESTLECGGTVVSVELGSRFTRRRCPADLLALWDQEIEGHRRSVYYG